jgi:uncharacterized membrane protein
VLFFFGLVIFLGAHLFTGLLRGPREGLVGRVGAGPYKGMFSIIALIGLLLIVVGWGNADRTVIYAPPDWTRHLTYVFMLLALILLAASSLPSGRLAAAVKHPMLAGVKIWAFAHLLVNGDIRSIMLFGSFLAFAVIDRIAVKKRGAPTPAPGPVRNDFIAVGVGIVAWIAIYMFLHPYIGGVALAA